MKKLFPIISLVLLFAFAAIPANASANIIGWNTSGAVQLVYDVGSPNPFYHVEAVGGSGALWQTTTVPSGDPNTTVTVFCMGNGQFTVASSSGTFIQTCPNAASWTVLIFNSVSMGGDVTLRADLNDGDKVDAFCLYNTDVSCPPALNQNSGFDEVPSTSTPTFTPTPTATATLTPTPTLCPKKKCR